MKKIIKELYKNRFFYILINHLYNFYLTSKLTNPYLRGHKLRLLDKEIDFFIKKINKGENFALVRNGDGERAIMRGKKVIAQEKWESPDYISKLGYSLLDSLNVDNANFYYGIPCPCCDKEAYYWYESRINSKNKTFANLWVNTNFTRFKFFFDNIKKDAILIANYRAIDAKIGNLNIIKHYKISDDCINFWENDASKMISQIKKDFGDKNNLFFVISAGPMSSPIIKELFLHNPNNTYIDFGSSIDCYYNSAFKRPYLDKHSIFGCRNCYIYDDFNCDISVVLTLYKRPEVLSKQIESILNQSIRPKELILFIDNTNLKNNENNEIQNLPKELASKFDNIISVKFNVGVWGRFCGGLLAKSKYICFFDDDTIPAHRWLENCHSEILKKDGLYGGIGILSNDLSKYPFDLVHRTIGWNNNPPYAINNKKTTRVDFIGHSWFLKKDYLGAMWLRASEFYLMRNVAEDAYLSFALKKYLNINSYIPPHKESDFFSSTKGLEYGANEASIFLNNENLLKMNNALKILKSKYKMKEVSFNFKWYLIYTARKLAIKFIQDEAKLQTLKSKIKEKFKK